MVRKGKEASQSGGSLAHPGEGHITVTAQQSRYAQDAIDAPASKEVPTVIRTGQIFKLNIGRY